VTPLNMPQVGQDIPKGRIVQWRIAEGEPVRKGEVVLEVESEKAAFEVEATDEGVLLKQVYSPGDEAPVFEPVAWVGAPDEEVPDDAAPATPEEGGEVEEAVAGRAPVPASAPASTSAAAVAAPPSTGRVFASPSARRIARERGLDLAGIAGSGPSGRVIKRDVLGAVPTATAAAPSAGAGIAPRVEDDDEVLPFDRMRRAIADRLLASRQTIPEFTVEREVDLTALLAWRAVRNQGAATKVSINDLILRATARALRAWPALNSHVAQDRVVLKRRINLGVAVAVEGGLLVPVLERADELRLEEIAIRGRELADGARAGRVDPAAIGTFTISNLGAAGVDRFQAIINPPECAILAVGAVKDRVVAVGDLFGVRKMLTLTLSADHRAVDGAYAAGFLADLAEHLAP